ncbi:12006_t:CDS:2, partial [Gigaspora margarita]
QNKVKLVTIEDESSSPVNSDVEAINKNNQSSFDTNFGHLSIEILKFLYYELGISDVDTKQNLVNRLGNEAKKINGLSGLENSGKEKQWRQMFKANMDADQAFANVFGTPLSDNGNPFAKIGDDFPPQMFSSGESPFTGLLLDKALLFKQVEYVQLARQVALERADIVRVADEDGWGVAAKMALEDSIDPMSELFSRKCERARMAMHLFSKNKCSKVSSSLY